MFSLARVIVRNKIAFIALIGIGIFAAMPSESEDEGPSSPWAIQSQPKQVAQVDEGGFVSNMMDDASEFLEENGMNVIDKADSAVDRFDNTASVYSKANK